MTICASVSLPTVIVVENGFRPGADAVTVWEPPSIGMATPSCPRSTSSPSRFTSRPATSGALIVSFDSFGVTFSTRFSAVPRRSFRPAADAAESASL